jgi:hypothetical protein
MIDLRFAGLDDLKREMARLSAAVQTRLAKNASMAMARVVARHARENAPVVTGALRAGPPAPPPGSRTPEIRNFAF